MTDLNKIWVIRLTQFNKEILKSRVAEFSFQKFQYVQKDMSYCIREKDSFIDT